MSVYLQAAEHGYHIGRQLDQAVAEADELRLQLVAADVQRATLIEKVAEGFIHGAHWKACQVCITSNMVTRCSGALTASSWPLVAAAAPATVIPAW